MEVKERRKEPLRKKTGEIDLSKRTSEYDSDEKNVKNGSTRQLPDKVFKIRNSLLTDLFEKNTHIHTIYHASIAFFISCLINTFAHEYFRERRINMGIRLIIRQFGTVHIALFYWCLYTLTSVIFFYLFKLWAIIRINNLPRKGTYLRLWDSVALLSCFGYYLVSFMSASSIVSTYNLSISTMSIICIEQVRYLMKIHSFWRHNCENVLKYKMDSDQEIKLPTLSKFLYFLFAPTLLYRDNYPRTNRIRWKIVVNLLIEFVLIIFAMSFTIECLKYPTFKEFGKTRNKWKEIILSILYNSCPAMLIYLLGFYVLLHVIQNLFAEILCFGDRLFYDDWWNSTGFLSFFRTWNIVVGDWLYTYIYKDVYQLLFFKKSMAKLTAFLVSAIVHEWILCQIFGCLLPVIFFEMIGSGCLALLKSPKNSNLKTVMWYSLILGNGLNATIYGLEYFIRNSLPLEKKGELLPQIFFLGK